MNLTVDTQFTDRSLWVDVFVPEDFDLDNEDHYEALNDVLGPYGGTSETESIYRESPTLVMVRYLRD